MQHYESAIRCRASVERLKTAHFRSLELPDPEEEVLEDEDFEFDAESLRSLSLSFSLSFSFSLSLDFPSFSLDLAFLPPDLVFLDVFSDFGSFSVFSAALDLIVPRGDVGALEGDLDRSTAMGGTEDSGSGCIRAGEDEEC